MPWQLIVVIILMLFVIGLIPTMFLRRPVIFSWRTAKEVFMLFTFALLWLCAVGFVVGSILYPTVLSQFIGLN